VEPSTEQGTAGSALIPVGTTGSVLATFSPDGKYVLITGENRTPLLWDVGQLFPTGAALLPETTFASVFPSQTASDNLVTTFDGKLSWFDLAAEPVSVKGAREDAGFGEPLFTAGFTSNGPIYVTADLVQSVPPLSVFTFDSEQPVTTIRPSAPVLLATISQDGTLLAGYDTNRGLTVWSATTGEEVSTLPPAVDILSLAFSPDGTRLATGASNGRWTIFSVETGAETATGRHRRSVNSVDFNADGSRLATASDDGTVKIWEPSNGTELASFDIGAKALRAVYSPDSTLLLIQNASSEWSIISAGDGTPLADLGQFTYLSVQLTPDNNHALALSYPADFYKLSLAPDGLAEQLKSKLEALGLPVGP
jgi:WD40 repeat protein